MTAVPSLTEMVAFPPSDSGIVQEPLKTDPSHHSAAAAGSNGCTAIEVERHPKTALRRFCAPALETLRLKQAQDMVKRDVIRSTIVNALVDPGLSAASLLGVALGA
mmetsp:Transcript_29536/g.60895  ORF Transcript_29536/g.60895 Transcript_29536/m.60895 type:complete len:106 (+) Transcript_29536:332-649(+)